MPLTLGYQRRYLNSSSFRCDHAVQIASKILHPHFVLENPLLEAAEILLPVRLVQSIARRTARQLTLVHLIHNI